MDIVPSDPLARDLSQLDAATIVRLLIEGREEPPGPLAKALNERGYVLPPLPNLFFTRDSCTISGKHVLVGSMRYAIRWTEAIIMKTIFLHHPQLANDGILYDGASERRVNYTLEGGDVHALRHDLVVIGFSERSSPAGIDQLASLFFEHTDVTDILVVVMPKVTTAIHLDMVFTQVDRDPDPSRGPRGAIELQLNGFRLRRRVGCGHALILPQPDLDHRPTRGAIRGRLACRQHLR